MPTQTNHLCCLPMEIKVREFDSRVYLETRFLAKSHPVLLGQNGGVHQQMFRHSLPLACLSKGLHQDANALYEKIHAFGGGAIRLVARAYPDIEGDLTVQISSAAKSAPELCDQICASLGGDNDNDNDGDGDREIDPEIAACIQPFIANADFNCADRIVSDIESRGVSWVKGLSPIPETVDEVEASRVARGSVRNYFGRPRHRSM